MATDNAAASRSRLFDEPREDWLALHREEAAPVVRQRATGQGPLDALHRHFLDGLRDRDPVTGLNDHPQVLAYHRMIFATPSLRAARLQYTEHDEQAFTLRSSRPIALQVDGEYMGEHECVAFHAAPRALILLARLPLLPSGKPDLERLRSLATQAGTQE